MPLASNASSTKEEKNENNMYNEEHEDRINEDKGCFGKFQYSMYKMWSSFR